LTFLLEINSLHPQLNTQGRTMKTLIKFLTTSIALVVWTAAVAPAAEQKEATKNQDSVASSGAGDTKEAKVAERAKRMIAEDKDLHAALSAALKAKDTAKVQSLFRKKGLDLGPIHMMPNPHCVRLPHGQMICDT
jgi:hypothetical protein